MNICPVFRPSRRGIFFLTVIALLLSFAAATHAASSCDVEVRLDALMVSTNVSKVGFPPLLDNHQNPAIYFKKLREYSESRIVSCYVCHEESSKTTSDTWIYDGLTGAAPVWTNWSGFLSYYSETNGTTAIDCTSTRIDSNTWSNSSCNNAGSAATDVVISNRTMSTFTLAKYSAVYELVTTSSGSAVHQDISESDLFIELTQPYALSDFLSTATAVVNAKPWPNWTNATRTGWAERGGRNVITLVNDERGEFDAALTRLKYRIAVRGPKDEKQTITWIERFIPNGGGPVVDTPLSEEVTFTGQEQYLLATQQDQGKIVEPPTQTGRLEVLVISTWSCDGISCGPGKGKVSTGSIDVRMSLGKTASGESAGYLFIKEEAPRSDIATPQRLGRFIHPDVNVVADGSNLRQVSAPQTLAQIVPIALGYEVRFYEPTTNKDANEYFIPTGQPFFTWKIESPGNDPNKLRVTQLGLGDPLESNFEWSAADQAWALVIGNFRKEIRVTTVDGIDRTETFTVREINDTLTYQQSRTWRQYGGLLGDLLISETIGTGGDALTTTWSYYTNPVQSGSYGKVSTVTRPNGAEEEYEYDSAGRLSGFTGPFANASQGRYTQYFYSSIDPLDDGTRDPNEARTIIESVLGAEVRRTYRSVRTNETLEIQCQTPGASWNALNNLITTNRTYTVGGSSNTVMSSFYPDGTLRIVSSPAAQPGVPRTETESVGQPNAAGTDIVDGTRNATQFDGAGRIILRETVDIASGALSREDYEYADDFGPATRVVYLDGTSTSTTYGCCNATATIDRDGTLTTYTYDGLDRLTATMRNGITFTNAFDAMGNILRTTRLGTDGSPMIVSEASFDTAGRQTSSTQGGGTTTAAYAFGGSQVTTSYADGGSRTDSYSQEGPLLSTTGTAVPPVSYEYGVETDGGASRQFTKETRTGGNDNEWTKTYFDMLGRAYKTVLSDTNYTESFYNAKGQLWKQRGFDGRVTLYAYNARGEVEYTALDVGNPDVIDLAGSDRVTQTVTDVSGGKLRTRTYFFPTAGSSNSVLMSTRESSPDGRYSSENSFGATTEVQIDYPGGGVQRTTFIAPDGSRTISYDRGDQLLSTTLLGAGGEELGRTTYRFDAHGRVATETDGRTGTMTTNQYNEEDLVSDIVTPALPDVPSQTTKLFYDGHGRMIRTLKPDGLNLTNQFNLQGQLKTVFGARTYPVDYSYDSQGRMTNLLTRSSAGNANTGWIYHQNRGWLVSKRHANNVGPDYTRAPDGRIQTRTTPRSTTTYGYTTAGDLASLTYSTNGQNIAFLDLDRLGRATRVTVGTNTTQLAYHASGLLISETAGGLVVTNGVSASLGEASVALQRSGGPTLFTHSFSHDGAGRLQTVTAGSLTVNYSYLAKSPLIQDVTFRYNSNFVMATLRTYDHLNRLTEIGSSPAAAPPLTFRYRHNLADQRTNVTEADGSYWRYQYDSLGQLTSGKKYFIDGTPVAGQQFEYTFDSIGNRTATKAGGDAGGASLRLANYTANTLNQYTNRTVPGAVDVLGHAPAAASVTVNGSATYRKGDYWQLVLGLNNASTAVWHGLTNVATLQGNKQTNTGNVFLPRTPESFAYDDDGNLLTDGRWNLTWDAENRLIMAEARNDIPDGARKKLVFEYDWRGRRISKTVWIWNATTQSYELSSRTQFAYDGWRMIAELDATQNPPALRRSYVWGADLSGTLGGAGGVGGLLAMVDHVANATYFYVHDGNGNVRALINAADGTVAAQYDWGPFGEPIRATGPMAKVNPFRWSTKYWDEETDFVDYGRRIYSPATGRWLSRDTLEEDGGLNLYGFCNGDPINQIDPDGQAAEWHHLLPQQWRSTFERLGFNIDSPKYGLVMDVVKHRTGETSLHVAGWNPEWKAFMKAKNGNPTRPEVLRQLRKMYKSPKYAAAIKGAKKAKMARAAWKAATTAERNALHGLGPRVVQKLGKGGVFKKVAPGLSLLFVFHNVEAKGVDGGMAETLFDATPYMGWVKLGSECVWGDWFPDGDGPEEPFVSGWQLVFPTGTLMDASTSTFFGD